MDTVVYLLAAYGVVFGVQQKLPSIRFWRLVDLLDCPYCLGFWAGWFMWGMSYWAGSPLLGSLVPGGLVWAFASAGACQIIEEWLVRRGREP